MILNSPNNPTGAVYTSEELKALAEICRENKIIVISDEIYAQCQFYEGRHASIATYYPEGTIITAGLSKLFCAGGYRFGVALIPENMPELVQSFLTVIDGTINCVAAPVQYAALAAYSKFDQMKPYLEATIQCHRVAVEYCCKRFRGMGLESTDA